MPHQPWLFGEERQTRADLSAGVISTCSPRRSPAAALGGSSRSGEGGGFSVSGPKRTVAGEEEANPLSRMLGVMSERSVGLETDPPPHELRSCHLRGMARGRCRSSGSSVGQTGRSPPWGRLPHLRFCCGGSGAGDVFPWPH